MPHVCPWWGGYFIDNRLTGGNRGKMPTQKRCKESLGQHRRGRFHSQGNLHPHNQARPWTIPKTITALYAPSAVAAAYPFRKRNPTATARYTPAARTMIAGPLVSS